MRIDHFIAGGIAGSLQSVIGHPLDTLKTLSQNNLVMSSFSVKKLYSGLSASLIQSSFLTGSAFYINTYFYHKTQNNLLSSLYTGIFGCLIICPLEDFKIKRQISYSLDLTCNISFSNIKKSYTFLHLVSLREIPAITLYFSSYRYLREYSINPLLSGGISGSLSWLITYPIDTIKSRLQSNLCSNVRQSIQMGNLYYGLKYCLLRAFIVNGVSFYMYEEILTALEQRTSYKKIN